MIKISVLVIVFFTISCAVIENKETLFSLDFSSSAYEDIEGISELELKTKQFFIDSIKIYGQKNSINQIQEIEESFIFTCLHEFEGFWISHCEKSLVNAMINNSMTVNPIRTDYSLTNNRDEQDRDIFKWCLDTKSQYECALFVYAWFDMRVSSCVDIFSRKKCNLMYDKVLGKYNKEINFVTH
jgi:hypothetical protein